MSYSRKLCRTEFTADQNAKALATLVNLRPELAEGTCDLDTCQGIDAPDSNVLFLNGFQGGPTRRLNLDTAAPIVGSIEKPPAGGNGKFVAHLNAGHPGPGTVTALPASLGDSCFDFLIPPFGAGTPVAVWNGQLGKTQKVGATEYFGAAGPDPARAPVGFWNDPNGDPFHLPIGSLWTLQAVIVNPTATSPKNASVTNALLIEIVPSP